MSTTFISFTCFLMVGSCVTTTKMKNVGYCVNNIHSLLWMQYIRFESIHTLEMISHQCTFSSCLWIMPKLDQIVTKCNLEETCWSMVNEMMVCVNGNEYTTLPTEDVLSLWKWVNECNMEREFSKFMHFLAFKELHG